MHRPHVSGDLFLADRIAESFVKMSDEDRFEMVEWVREKLREVEEKLRCSRSEKLRSRIVYEILVDWAEAGIEKDEFYKNLVEEHLDCYERQTDGSVKVGPLIYDRERLERPLFPKKDEKRKECINETVRHVIAEFFHEMLMGNLSSEEEDYGSEGTKLFFCENFFAKVFLRKFFYENILRLRYPNFLIISLEFFFD